MPRRARIAIPTLVGLVLPALATAAPPTITCPPAQSSFETATVAFTVEASDPDGDPVTLEAVALPRRATFDGASGSFQWSSDYLQAGSHVVEFRAIAAGETTTCSVPITIANLNRLPRVECPAQVQAVVGDTIRVRFLGSDPDGDPLVYTMTPMPAGATIASDGSLVWNTADAAVETRDYTIQVSDGANTATCAWRVVLAPPGSEPFITCPGAQQVMEVRPLSFSVTAGGEVGPLPLSAFDLPPGSVFTPATHVFTWTPQEGQAGAYAPAFVVTNPFGIADTCRVAITVTPHVWEPPVILCPGPIAVLELERVDRAFPVTDPEGLPLTVSVMGLPTGATFDIPTRRLRWTPAVGQVGVFDVRITAANAHTSSFCEQRIEVGDRTFPPPVISCPGPQEVLERRTLNLLVRGSDPNGLPIVSYAADLPAGASYDGNTGQFSWTPASDQVGVHYPRFRAANLDSSSAYCTVPITVGKRANSPPTITAPTSVITVERRDTREMLVTTDAEADLLYWTVRGLPPGATLPISPSQGGIRYFFWTPDSTAAGVYPVEFVVSDGEFRDSVTITVTVLDHVGPVDQWEPVLYSVEDVFPDQGGYVRLDFVTAARDPQPGADVTGYNVWRRVSPTAAAATTLSGTEPATVSGLRSFPPGTWESVAFVQAVQSSSMRIVAPTRRDSTGEGVGVEVYVVSAHSTDPSTWFVSRPESAYSVDDLPPTPPTLRVAPSSSVAGAVRLSWDAIDDLDFARFEVHRGSTGDFVASTGTRLATTEDTTWLDPAPLPVAWYRVLARDLNGNASSSPVVESTGGSVVPVADLALGAPYPSPTSAGIEAMLQLGIDQRVRVAILDARGRRVRVLLDEVRGVGTHPVQWDGRDDAGVATRTGIYFLRVESDAGVETRKFVRVGSGAAPGS